MQRRREQRGTVCRIGGYWCLRYADFRIENGVRIRKQGLTTKLTSVLNEHARLRRPPKYVKDLQQAFMKQVNDTLTAPERCSTISQFVDSTWLPHVKENRASSTHKAYEFYWQTLLKPFVGDQLLRDFSPKQALHTLREIKRLHPKMRTATLQKLRSILSAIFKLGIALEYRTGVNPVRAIETPKGLPSSATYAYSLEEIQRIVGLIEHETTRVIVALAGYAGLSKSEIQGLTWEAYDPQAGRIKVLCGVVNGKRGETKTEARKNTVPVIPQVGELLDLYRLRLGNPTKGVMFPTEAQTPVCLHNVFMRQIDPLLNVCAACEEPKAKHEDADHEFIRDQNRPEWHGWHAFRRGLASNLNDLGVPDLTIQRILRHKNVETTRKSYIKVREEGMDAGMAQFGEKVGPMRSEASMQKARRVN